jgi:predicted TIM-barrel fold metal-dependent hydrolase
LFGKFIDVDGHIYMPVDILEEFTAGLGESSTMSFYKRYVQSKEYLDDRKRNRDEVFTIKGMAALGATDPEGRVEALDLMGDKVQLCFSNTTGKEQRINSDEARRVNRLVNDYYLDWCAKTNGRVYPALQINMYDPKWAVEELERVLKIGGVGAINMACAEPPGGVSPAHSTWDPFWALLQEADIAATIHLGGGGLISMKDPDPMMPDRAWGNAESLKVIPAERGGGEEAVSPYFLLVAHVPAEIYLQTMVMGRVFERFPKLRFGILEFGTAWVGPCVQRMDMWADFQARVLGRKFEMKPSEYVRRNVRVGPFFHEDLATLLDQYGMDEIYCYSTDFPHLEGSKDPIGKFRERLAGRSEAYQEDFFINNAKWLMPYAA